jgi:redox-sensing transcriptional repressor
MQELFFLNKSINDFDSVIIYGAGNAGQAVLLKLLQRNIKVDCFADSDPEKCGKKFLNVPIYHIDELQDKHGSAIIVAGTYAFKVAEELKKRGYLHIFFDYGNEVRIIHLEREDW